MNMHILIIDEQDKHTVVKKSDIRRVKETLNNKTIVSFVNPKINAPIYITENPSDFFKLLNRSKPNK